MEEEYVTVTQLNNHIKRLVNSDSSLKRVYVRGEISNAGFSKGHLYFSLKDKSSTVGAMMYANNTKKLKFEPKDGMEVLVKGYVDVYPRFGNYKVYAEEITGAGAGDYYIALQQLKVKLRKLGWFDDELKKPIPKYPERIGVVTSLTGSAIHDIITTIKRRWPLCEIILFPSLVQGQDAPNDLIKQVILADTQFDLDTLIIGRGGGSIEDLWAFNNETLAKVIINTKTPIISAVGHEDDWTISDYVADLRAATPSVAAELAVPEINQVKLNLKQMDNRVNIRILDKLDNNKKDFEKIKNRRLFSDPSISYNNKIEFLINLENRLSASSNKIITSPKIRLSKIKNSYIFKGSDKLFENKSNRYKEVKYRLKFSGENLISKKGAKLSKIKSSYIFKEPNNVFRDKKNKFNNLKSSLVFSSKDLLRDKRDDFKDIKSSLVFSSKDLLRDKRDDLNGAKRSHVIKDPIIILNKKENSLQRYMDKLNVLNPLKTLKRGYTISRHNGKVISKSKDLKKNDEVEIEFDDGKINTRVL